jgi:transcriptional regulator GlxA family with amidase domain
MAGLVAKQKQIEVELESFRQELRQDLEAVPKNLVRVVEYVQNHLFDPSLNVNAIKSQYCLRDNNFSSAFRTALGVTPRDYIEILRMDAADRLLRGSDLEIYLIAMSVGYCHQETFFRAFHRRFGCPPSHRSTSRRLGRENIKIIRQEDPPRYQRKK